MSIFLFFLKGTPTRIQIFIQLLISGHNKIRKTAKHQLLAKKKFYLDIKNLEAPPVKQLAKDLIFLGGVSIMISF